MILVTGATGLTGSEVVRRLSAKEVPVRALVRSPARAAKLSTLPNVEIIEGDMARPENLSAAFKDVGSRHAHSSSAPDMLEVQSNFIEAARKAGIRHIVKLSGIIPELDFAFSDIRGCMVRLNRNWKPLGWPLRIYEPRILYRVFRRVPAIVAKGPSDPAHGGCTHGLD